MRLILLCITIIPWPSAASGGKHPKVAKAFETYLLTPAILPIAPNELLNLNYPTAEVCLGDVIPQTRTMIAPKIDYDFKPGSYYTLIMIDPDVPSAHAPTLRSYLVWLLMNIRIEAKSGQQVSDTIACYIPPTPYPGSGYHRYTALLYKQAALIDPNKLASRRLGVKRYKFDVISIAQQLGLGNPVAGNLFRSKIPAVYNEYYCTNSTTCLAG
nr:protein D2-like [Maniola hyperantus]